MATENKRIKTESTRKTTEALGQSDNFLEFQERLARVAPIDRPVLLLGERGTGKELAASRLHYLSKRWQGSLIALNCSALNPSLIESELFGFEKGAFTGADKRRIGRFESADGGTLFLDEIGNIPIEVQEKILRVVEYGTFERVGSSTEIEVDTRIIAATNADLLELASKGGFKQDLLDRISFEVLFLPPLRERKEDIMLLANHFAARMAFELDMEDLPYFTEDAAKALTSYSWPGNVRELKNLVERAVYRSQSSQIKEIVFHPFNPPFETQSISREKVSTPKALESSIDDLLNRPFSEAVNDLKIHLVKKALEDTKHNQRAAAKRLGLTYHQFRGIYRKFRGEIESD
jgi:psp operon transcriptional activator